MCRIDGYIKKKNTTHNSLDLLEKLRLNLEFFFKSKIIWLLLFKNK